MLVKELERFVEGEIDARLRHGSALLCESECAVNPRRRSMFFCNLQQKTAGLLLILLSPAVPMPGELRGPLRIGVIPVGFEANLAVRRAEEEDPVRRLLDGIDRDVPPFRVLEGRTVADVAAGIEGG